MVVVFVVVVVVVCSFVERANCNSSQMKPRAIRVVFVFFLVSILFFLHLLSSTSYSSSSALYFVSIRFVCVDVVDDDASDGDCGACVPSRY